MPPLRATVFERLPIRGFIGAVFAFGATELLVLLGAFYSPSVGAGSSAAAGLGIFDLVLAFGIATVLMLVLIRTSKSAVFFAALFGLALTAGLANLLLIWLAPLPAVLIALAAVLGAARLKRVGTTDALVILGLAGVAVSLGSAAGPETLLVFLALLSFYDIIAVYRTKHMVSMARALFERGVCFALFLPPNLRGLGARISEARSERGFFLLGTGDLVLPAALVSAAAFAGSPLAALAAGAGSLVGLTALLLLFSLQSEKRPMPALPPIATATIIGYLIGIYL